MMINKLRKINENLIDKYQTNEEKLNKQLLIKKLLNEEQCFFKINIEIAYSILNDLEIPEELWEKVYSELIDIKNYNEN